MRINQQLCRNSLSNICKKHLFIWSKYVTRFKNSEEIKCSAASVLLAIRFTHRSRVYRINYLLAFVSSCNGFMLSWVTTSANLNWTSPASLTQHDCVHFQAEPRKTFWAHFYGSSPGAWAPATRTLFNHFISWGCFCPEFHSSIWATVLCWSQPWSINNKLNGGLQAGGLCLRNVKGLYHYSWQLLIYSPAGQSLQITGTQFHAIICVSGLRGVDWTAQRGFMRKPHWREGCGLPPSMNAFLVMQQGGGWSQSLAGMYFINELCPRCVHWPFRQYQSSPFLSDSCWSIPGVSSY